MAKINNKDLPLKVEARAADGVRVVHAPYGFHQVSDDVAQIVAADLANPDRDATWPSILAVCTFQPSDLYIMIEREVAESRDPQFKSACLEAFKRDCSLPQDLHAKHDPQADESEEPHAAAAAVFRLASHTALPHFARLDEHCEKVMRLCLFMPETEQPDGFGFDKNLTNKERRNDYLDAFQCCNEEHHCYAFFRWLNRENECRIVPPDQWGAWGLAEPRDFAILSKARLVEYLPPFPIYLIGRKRYNRWPVNLFGNVEDLLSCVDMGRHKDLWSPDEFLDLVFGDHPTEELRNEIVLLRKRLDQEYKGKYDQVSEHVANLTKIGVESTRRSRAKKVLHCFKEVLAMNPENIDEIISLLSSMAEKFRKGYG